MTRLALVSTSCCCRSYQCRSGLSSSLENIHCTSRKWESTNCPDMCACAQNLVISNVCAYTGTALSAHKYAGRIAFFEFSLVPYVRLLVRFSTQRASHINSPKPRLPLCCNRQICSVRTRTTYVSSTSKKCYNPSQDGSPVMEKKQSNSKHSVPTYGTVVLKWLTVISTTLTTVVQHRWTATSSPFVLLTCTPVSRQVFKTTRT